jgi:hypothetical protein
MSLFSDVFSLPVNFKNSLQSSLTVYSFFCQVCLLVKETAEIEIGMAEKSSWDQANIRQNYVWFGEIERKLA